MAFNPDEYLSKQKASGFDPDAYLASQKPAPKDGMGQAMLESYGNTATLGYLPHLQALASKITPDPTASLDAELRAKGFNVTNAPKQGFLELRDENLKRQAQQSQDFPTATKVGTGLGIAAAALLPAGAAAKAAQGAKLTFLGKGAAAIAGTPAATLGARMGQAAGTGFVIGGAANPGDTEGEIDPLQAGARLQNAALGGIIGPIAQGAGEKVLGPIAQKAAEWLKNKAAKKATRALGRPTPTEAKNMAKSGQDVELGRTLLDEGAIPILGTPGRIAKRVEALKEKAGEKVGALIDEVDSQKAQYTPIKILKPKQGVVAKEEVLATPIRIDENPLKESMPWLRPEDVPPKVLRGETQPVQAAMMEKPQYKIIRGEVKEIPIRGAEVDTGKLAKSILGSDEFQAMRTTPGMEGAAAAIEKQVETLAANGKLTLRGAQELRQRIDKSINFNKTVPEMRGAQEGLYMQRTKVRDAMNEAVNKLNPSAGKDALKIANRKYGNLAQAQEIAEKEAGRLQANRAISLTDTIAGAAGASTGNPLLSVALGAANKAGRTFGNSMQARGYNAAGGILAKAPALAAFVSKNPVAGQVVLNRMTDSSSFKEGESNPLLDNPQILGMFESNPDLIESVQDPKMRDKIRAKINRKPADNPIKRRAK